MKTHRAIARAWLATFVIDLGEPSCMACGSIRKKWRDLERAHLVPKALGGTDVPENIVLLCNRCHHDAPDYVDPSFMIEWIKARPANPFGLNFGVRELARAFEDIGADIQSMTDIPWDPFRKFIKDRVNTHGAQLTASTAAAAAVDYYRRNSAQPEGLK